MQVKMKDSHDNILVQFSLERLGFAFETLDRNENERSFPRHSHQRRLIKFKFNVRLYKFKFLPAQK